MTKIICNTECDYNEGLGCTCEDIVVANGQCLTKLNTKKEGTA